MAWASYRNRIHRLSSEILPQVFRARPQSPVKGIVHVLSPSRMVSFTAPVYLQLRCFLKLLSQSLVFGSAVGVCA